MLQTLCGSLDQQHSNKQCANLIMWHVVRQKPATVALHKSMCTEIRSLPSCNKTQLSSLCMNHPSAQMLRFVSDGAGARAGVVCWPVVPLMPWPSRFELVIMFAVNK
jgi:hypothetical protein